MAAETKQGKAERYVADGRVKPGRRCYYVHADTGVWTVTQRPDKSLICTCPVTAKQECSHRLAVLLYREQIAKPKEEETTMPNDASDKMVALVPSIPQGLSLLPSPEELQIMRDTADLFVKSGFLPKHLDTPEKAIVTMMVAREIGIPMHYGLSKLYPVDGKVSMQGELMLALVKRSGLYGYRFLKATEEECVFELWPRAYPDEKYTASATMKFAKEHGWHLQEWWDRNAGRMMSKPKQPWVKFPAHMLKWRCVSDAIRVVCPEIIAGMYTPEELGANVTVTDDGTVDVLHYEITEDDAGSEPVAASQAPAPQNGATPQTEPKKTRTRKPAASSSTPVQEKPPVKPHDPDTGEIIDAVFEPEDDAAPAKTPQRLDDEPAASAPDVTTLDLDEDDDEPEPESPAPPPEPPPAPPKAAKPKPAPKPDPEAPPEPAPELAGEITADQLAYLPDGTPANEATRQWEAANAVPADDEPEATPESAPSAPAVTDDEARYYENAGSLRAFLAAQGIKFHDKFKDEVGYGAVKWQDLDEDARCVLYIAARDGME
jgi:hypothetical protein